MTFHGFNITLHQSDTEYTLNEKTNAENTVFCKFIEQCEQTLTVEIPSETEYEALKENIEHDDIETMKINAFRTLRDFNSVT